MSWENYYRRRDAIDAVLRHAGSHPHHDLGFDTLPEVREQFTDERQLLLALQYKWTQLLTGYLNVALNDGPGEPVDAIGSAWRRTAANHPVLRSLLDTHLSTTRDPQLRAAVEREQRMLALSAGLADHGEPEDELAKVGAAYSALLRRTPERAVRHRPFTRLRKLAATN